jgi:hypothetical protein
MMEAIVAAIGFFVCVYICWIFASPAFKDGNGSTLQRALYLLISWPFGFVALYCVVRFIHWAWETRMPFVGER